MQTMDLSVDGGRLRALRWGDGPQVAVALHGITANAMSWAVVGRHLPPTWSLIALDQRGRGHSADLPGPYTVDQLADDAAAVVRATGARVLAGHSMGAYVALGAAHRHPGLVDRLVLVDGGLPLPVPAGLDPDAIIEATVGPAIQKLSMEFADEDAYVDFFRQHPSMGPYWTGDLEAYARYDARRTDGHVRARARAEAVRTSGRELILRAEDIAAAVDELDVPATLLLAERGMFDQAEPLLPPATVEDAVSRQSRLFAETIPETNHYTVLLGSEAAARIAAAIGSS